MIEYPDRIDDADRVYLMGAMCIANEREDALPEGEIGRVGITEVGRFFAVAQHALACIEKLHREDEDDWDGVVWYELLCSAEADSLADRLVYLIYRSGEDVPSQKEVRSTVIGWLRRIGI